MKLPIKKGPWQTTASRVTYENPWLTVREDVVIRPDGKPGIFGVVTMMPGVSVLPIDSEGNVYLAREYRYGLERETIEVFSGGIDPDEDRIVAVRRELQEESGLRAEEIIELGFIDPFTSIVNCPNYIYLARGLSQGEAQPEGTEVITIVKVPYQQAFEWVMESKITHGASVAAILKARQFIQHG